MTEELIAHYRALMLAALPGGQTLLSGVSPEEEAQYLEKGPRLGQREAIRAIRTLGNALEHMTRGSDQRIELELALFSLSEPAQQPVYAAAAAPARAAGIWTNTAAVWRWRVSAFWSRRAAAHRAPPPCWALMMNAGLSCAMTVKAALLP